MKDLAKQINDAIQETIEKGAHTASNDALATALHNTVKDMQLNSVEAAYHYAIVTEAVKRLRAIDVKPSEIEAQVEDFATFRDRVRKGMEDMKR